jgi:hypothetical protein
MENAMPEVLMPREKERDWELGLHRGHAWRAGAQVGFYFVPSH